jgi:hypothetical protein
MKSNFNKCLTVMENSLIDTAIKEQKQRVYW